jgi:hypothetical protein
MDVNYILDETALRTDDQVRVFVDLVAASTESAVLAEDSSSGRLARGSEGYSRSNCSDNCFEYRADERLNHDQHRIVPVI